MRKWKITTSLLVIVVLCLLCLGSYSWYRIETLTDEKAQLSYAYNQQNVAIEQLGKINDENIASWRNKVSDLEVEIKDLEEQIQELISPTLPVEIWSPNRDRLRVVPQLRQGSADITVPPADYLIIPISVGEYEHLATWGWSASGENEDYLDSWLVNSNGTKVSESGRTFNYSCYYTIAGSPGLGSGTWYIYLSNEFTSFTAKDVTLWVHWQ